MNRLRDLLTLCCLGLALLSSPGRGEPPAAADDTAAEDKARSYFTDLEVIDQNEPPQLAVVNVVGEVLEKIRAAGCSGCRVA